MTIYLLIAILTAICYAKEAEDSDEHLVASIFWPVVLVLVIVELGRRVIQYMKGEIKDDSE